MIQHGMVGCIRQMPDKLFLTTGIPACIFILIKNRDGEHCKGRKEIMFVDARKLERMASRPLN